MKVRIVELFSEGIRLPRESVLDRAPVVGELTVDIMATEVFSGQRQVSAARLQIAYGARRIMADIIPPLFQVSLLRMTSGGFVLRGIQLSNSSEGIRQFAQEWWAREGT